MPFPRVESSSVEADEEDDAKDKIFDRRRAKDARASVSLSAENRDDSAVDHLDPSDDENDEGTDDENEGNIIGAPTTVSDSSTFIEHDELVGMFMTYSNSLDGKLYFT